MGSFKTFYQSEVIEANEVKLTFSLLDCSHEADPQTKFLHTLKGYLVVILASFLFIFVLFLTQ